MSDTRYGKVVYDRGVRVYWNLHKKCWSIQSYIQGKGWRVTAHKDQCVLTNVTFKVSEAGRQRVLATGRKNVHAFACAEYVTFWHGPVGEKALRISYNPYRQDGFRVAYPLSWLDECNLARIDYPARVVCTSDGHLYQV